MRFSFCPKCGGPLALEHHDGEGVPTCQNNTCRFAFWQAAKPAVGVIITNEKGHWLMTIRAQAPAKDKLDMPGGFLREDEDPFQGAVREIQEELGIQITPTGILGHVVDRYGAEGDYTLNIGVIADLVAGTLTPHPKEISAITWIIPATVDRSRLAFANAGTFIDLWLAQRK